MKGCSIPCMPDQKNWGVNLMNYTQKWLFRDLMSPWWKKKLEIALGSPIAGQQSKRKEVLPFL